MVVGHALAFEVRGFAVWPQPEQRETGMRLVAQELSRRHGFARAQEARSADPLGGRRRRPGPSPTWARAAGGGREWRPGYVVLAKARTISRQKAGRSSGFLAVIRLPSTTTSLSDH
jgi:hypothetical protein